jgi:hypothetical protein
MGKLLLAVAALSCLAGCAQMQSVMITNTTAQTLMVKAINNDTATTVVSIVLSPGGETDWVSEYSFGSITIEYDVYNASKVSPYPLVTQQTFAWLGTPTSKVVSLGATNNIAIP